MTENRRPISARNSGLMRKLAAAIARNGQITPNQISCLSSAAAGAGAFFLLLPGQTPAALAACALFVQLRLLCNLIDGMVAVEGGQKTPAGELYNELPDRLSDSLLLVALGYACGAGWLGWLAALLAAFTAYIRVFGGSTGLAQSFRGPMAKQHRMAVLTAACLLAIAEQLSLHSTHSLTAALVLITIGSAATCVLRTRDIARALEERAAKTDGAQT